METDKATMTVASPCKGRLENFSAQLDESYAVGATLGRIEASPEEAARLGMDEAAPQKGSDTELLAKGEGNGHKVRRATDRARPAGAGQRRRRQLSFPAAQGAHG